MGAPGATPPAARPVAPPLPAQGHDGGPVFGPRGAETYRTPPRGVAVHAVGRRRGRAVVGGWVAAGVVVVGAVAFGGGFDRGHSAAARPDGGAPRTSVPAQQAPGGREYRGVGLAAGNGLALETDPPQTRPGAENGTFGYTPDGEAFVSDAARGALALLGPEAPGTLDGCRGEDNVVVSVPRTQLTAGSRLCVMGADGTTALVTFRQLSDPGGPAAHATLDLTVWPARQL